MNLYDILFAKSLGGGGGGGTTDAVKYTPQTLTSEQQAQARENISSNFVIIATSSGSSYTCDKTLDEVNDAITNGIMPVLIIDDIIFCNFIWKNNLDECYFMSNDAPDSASVYEFSSSGLAFYDSMQYLPPVSYSDNGKILQVEDGRWYAVSIPNAEEVSY